jgi:hypothetical protein
MRTGAGRRQFAVMQFGLAAAGGTTTTTFTATGSLRGGRLGQHQRCAGKGAGGHQGGNNEGCLGCLEKGHVTLLLRWIRTLGPAHGSKKTALWFNGGAVFLRRRRPAVHPASWPCLT